jgi:hypothetical protein
MIGQRYKCIVQMIIKSDISSVHDFRLPVVKKRALTHNQRVIVVISAMLRKMMFLRPLFSARNRHDFLIEQFFLLNLDSQT